MVTVEKMLQGHSREIEPALTSLFKSFLYVIHFM